VQEGGRGVCLEQVAEKGGRGRGWGWSIHPSSPSAPTIFPRSPSTCSSPTTVGPGSVAGGSCSRVGGRSRGGGVEEGMKRRRVMEARRAARMLPPPRLPAQAQGERWASHLVLGKEFGEEEVAVFRQPCPQHLTCAQPAPARCSLIRSRTAFASKHVASDKKVLHWPALACSADCCLPILVPTPKHAFENHFGENLLRPRTSFEHRSSSSALRLFAGSFRFASTASRDPHQSRRRDRPLHKYRELQPEDKSREGKREKRTSVRPH
jgi:hypothetical protein